MARQGNSNIKFKAVLGKAGIGKSGRCTAGQRKARNLYDDRAGRGMVRQCQAVLGKESIWQLGLARKVSGEEWRGLSRQGIYMTTGMSRLGKVRSGVACLGKESI